MTYTVSGTAPSADPLPTLSNTATVGVPVDVIDLDPSNDSSTVDVAPAAAVSDLSITKLDDPDPVQVNGELTYTIQASNAGPEDAADATVVDTLPADVTFGTADGGADWTCAYDAGTHEVTCTANAAIVAGVDPSAITVTATAPAAAATLVNSVEVSSTTDANMANNTATAETAMEEPELPFITCDTDSALFNTGYDGVGGSLPVGAVDANWDAALGDPANPNAIPSAWIDATVVGQVVSIWEPSPFGNAEWISYYPDGGTHAGEVDIYYRFEFELDAAVDPASFALAIDYYVDNSVWEVYVNGVAQSGNLGGVLPQDPADPYFHGGFVAGSQAQTVLTNDWQTGTNVLIVHTKSAAPRTGFLAQVTSESLCAADVSIVKSAAPDPAVPDEDLVYTLQVNNAGPGNAADATVTDTLPAEVGFVNVEGGADWICTYDDVAHAVNCVANANLPIGDADPIVVTVTAPATPTSLVNAAEVTSTPEDPNPDNNTSTITTEMEELDWTPFVCDGSGYVIGAFGGTNSSQLQVVNTSALPFTFEPIGPMHSGFELNPVAYNPSDNLLYALNVTLSGGQATINGLSTVDATGEVSTPVPVTGLPSPAPGGGYISGDIAPDGYYYVYAADDTVMYQIDLSTMVAVPITLSSAQTIGDFAAHPTDGLLYSTNASNEVVTINPANGQVDITPIATGSLEGSGGHWFTADGSLMVYGGGDQLWQVDLDAPGGPAVIGANTVPGAVRADAASCAARDVMADLSVTKTADPEPVTAGGELTYTLQVFNAGPDAAADATVVDSLPADVTFTSVDGGADWTCAYEAGTHQVSCDANGAVGLGNADPITITVNVASTAIGDLVNTVNVTTTTEDPNEDNNDDDTTTTVEEMDWTPWVCDGRALLNLVESGTDPSIFYWVDTRTDPYGFEEAYSNDEYTLNAIGYDNDTDLVWATTQDRVGTDGFVGIISIDGAGVATDPVIPTGLPDNSAYVAGTVANGVYYITNGDLDVIYAIDLTTFDVEAIQMDRSLASGDITFAPDGWIYAGVNVDTGLVRVDPTAATPTVENVTVGGMSPGAFGSIWANASGDLFLYENDTDTIVQIDLNIGTGDDPVVRNTVAAEDQTGGSDATNCTDYVPFADLAITKTADPDPVAPVDTLTYTLQVSNLGADSAADATVTDTLPADVTFLSVDGGADWTCAYDEATHSVECIANGEVPLGPTDPITVEVRAPLAQVSLVNQATLTSSTDDPDLSNNEDEITTEMEELDWTPFICDGTGYIFQDLPGGWLGQLFSVDTSVLPYTFNEIGPEHPNVLVNAIGYHPTQNVLYGWAMEDSDPNSTTDPAVVLGLVRIDATGEITELGIPDGMVEAGYHVGTISNDGSTYYVTNNTDPAGGIYAVDLATMTSEVITLDAPLAIADFVESPTEPGVLYATVGTDLIRITLDLAANTGTVETIPIDGFPTVVGVGGAWMTADGDFIAYDNGGQVIQVDLDDPANPVVIAVVENAPVSGSNDGASCTARDIMADLSVTKTADPEPVTAGGELTYTLQVFNAGPDNAADATVVDTLPADVSFTSVDGGTDWTCAYEAGTHQVSCDANGAVPLGNADPITITVNVASTATGDLVNTVNVTSSTEDPDESDNEDDTTTTVEELDWEPFVCSGLGYVIQDPQDTADLDAQLYSVNTSQLPYTFDEIGGTTPYMINAIGYHPTHNALYGWAWERTPGQTPMDVAIGVVRIDATGAVTELGIPTGVPDPAYHVGAVSNDGATYYIRVGGTEMYAIDLATMTATTITLDATPGVSDFAERPGEPGVLYHINADGDLVRITVDVANGTGTVDTIDVPDVPAAGYGASWFTAQGDLIAYDNAGTVYQISLDDAQNPQLVATVENAPSSGSNDGAACAAREPSADLSMDKTADPDTVGAGETLTYTLQVFNAGPDSAEDVVVTDTLPAGIASVDSVTGDGWNCATTMTEIECTRASLGLGNAPPITIVVTTGDTGGELVNSATVDTSTEDPDEENNEDEEETDVSNPEIVVDKVAEQITEIQVGDTIEYFYYVTNIGNVELTNISTVDDLIGPISCPLSTLPAGGTMTCVGEYIVTQDDFDNGEITNVATVTGEDPTGEEVEDDDEETVPNEQEPGIDVDKFAEPVDELVVGDVITYYYVVTNTGNVTLADITVEDDLIASVDCPVTELAPGESTTCTAEYTVTQEDFDAGEITNHATVTGEDPDGEEVEEEDEETVPNDNQEPRILVDKVALNADDLAVGDVVDYEYIVTNVGNVTLTNVSVADNLIPSVACPVTELAPTESVTCTASYMVSQADVDAGEIVNVAVVTGKDPDGDPIEDDDSERVEIGQESDIVVDKVAEQITEIQVGDTIEYFYYVTNIGNVTLTNITVDDNLIGPISCPLSSLPAGGTMTCVGEYVVTQEDFDNGEITNIATVTGEDPNGDPTEDDDEETVPNEQEPGIDVDKFAEPVDELVVGDVITYYYVVTNTGNVTLADITVEDDLIASVDCPVTELAPGESTTCTAEYTVTQADFDQGAVTNHATVTGDPPGDEDPPVDEDEETVPNDNQEPRVLVDKVAESVTELVPGDVIEYEYIVTNVGNVTLTNISVDDDLIATVNCPDVDLAPGDSATCTASYTVTQADVDRGEIVNIAVVTAEDPDGDPVEDEDREEVPDEEQVASIDVDKVAEQSGSLQVGDEIDFSFIVTNTGSVTLTEIEVDDPLIPNVSCPFTQLPPGQSMTCTGDYTVTQADVNDGEVVNQATVTGETPDGGEVDDDDEERVPTDEEPTPTPTEPTEPGPGPTPTPTEPTEPGPTPTEPTEPPTTGVEVDKMAEYVPELVAGDVIDYQFVVTNSGSVALEEVSVDDPLISNVSCPATELGPGESMTCTGSYTVTEADVENGQVVNNVTVSGDPEGEEPPIEDEDEEIVPNDPEPGMDVDKVAESVTELVAGDVIDYQFIVTNTGNLDLTDVSVDDPLIPNVSCPATELAMGETMTCTGSYTVTEADVANGQVVNNVIVSGDPEGDEPPIEDEDEEIVPNDPGQDPGPEPEAGVEIDKVAEHVETLVVGDVIDYNFIITNTGDMTLSNISVDDPLIPNVSCPQTELAAEQSTVCTGSYTVTQADVDNGQVVNNATVTAETPDGSTIEHADEEIVPNEAVAGISMDKVAEDVDALVVGDVITYQFIVTNTGNVTLTGVDVTDLLIPDVSCPATELAPGESMTCTGDYTVTQADVDNGSIVNVASVTTDSPGDLDPPEDSDTEIVSSDDDDDGKGDDDDGKDDDDPSYPQLPPDTGLDVESRAGPQDSSTQTMIMLIVLGSWMLVIGLAFYIWQRRRSMP